MAFNAYAQGHFARSSSFPHGYRCEVHYGTRHAVAGTWDGDKLLGCIYFGENRFFNEMAGSTVFPAPFHTNSLLIKLIISSYGTQFEDISFKAYGNTIDRFDTLYLDLYEGATASPIHVQGTYFLPDIPLSTGTIISLYGRIVDNLWDDDKSRTYYDVGLATLACGRRAIYILNDVGTISDSHPKSAYKSENDILNSSDSIRTSPFRHVETLKISDEFHTHDFHIGTITDWQFTPDYKVLIEDGDGFATTNWHGRINSYSNIRKSTKHWTGDFEIGNWTPEFVDEYNELYGSMYGGTNDFRMKEIRLSAMIRTTPLIYTPQFQGQIVKTTWTDGMVSFDTKDKMKDLPSRNFVFDYANLGSTDGKLVWGRVTKVFGTQVMFDDKGDMTYIERKKPGVSFLQSLTSGVLGGIVGAIGGGWAGFGALFANGFLHNLPTSDINQGGYYKVTDYNAIPDDTVRSGAKIKFLQGSYSGIATNSNSPLAFGTEYTINGGTMRNGYLGTFAIDTTDGINIGNFVYARKPIVYRGSPKTIIEALLCGSNIDYKYGTEDFADNWDDELKSMELMDISNIIAIDSNSTPFEEVKGICKELQLSFFINEDNKFAVRSIRPRGLINSGDCATYTQALNILDGFSFERGSEEAIAGVKFYYGYVGENNGAFKNGFNKCITMNNSNSIEGITTWEEIQSKWIHFDDDAKTIAWRIQMDKGRGVDRINLPTTLYGVQHNLSDLIRVTHNTGSLHSRLFEIESYDKSFDDSTVTLQAVDVERTYGYGNCLWETGSESVNTGTQSGISVCGPIGSLTQVGEINSGTLLPRGFANLESNILIYDSIYWGKILCFGSIAFDKCELFIMYGNNTFERGLFNTIARTYYAGEKIYLVGNAQYDVKGNLISDSLISNFRFATCMNINTNIGTSFRFF